MGRGQSSTLAVTATPRRTQRVVSPAFPANAVNPAIAEVIELAQQGNTWANANNELAVSTEDFRLLSLIESTLEDTEQETITARELDGKIPGLTAHTISSRLRKLADEGHVTASKEGKVWNFSLGRDLDEFYPHTTVHIPGAKARKFYGDAVQLSRYSNNDWIAVTKSGNNDLGIVPSVKTEAFVTGARNIARQVMKGETNSFQLVDAGKAPSGVQQYLAMFPYRLKKGLRQEPMVAFKFINISDTANISWHGTAWENHFLDGVVSAADLLSASVLLGDRRGTECGMPKNPSY